MSITIDFSPADLEIITEQAKVGNTSVEEFIRSASAKAARNAEYMAKIDRACQQSIEGRCTRHELIEVD